MRILDLFCGAGGSAMGLHRYFPEAQILGVDIEPRPRYPFDFVLADAQTYPLAGFDLIWASPPCQGYSAMRHLPWLREKDYPLLIEPIRARLDTNGAPYILENVAGARKALPDAGWLCGTQFGKRFYRHRLFASNFFWLAPGVHPKHVARIRSGSALGGRARDILFGGSDSLPPSTPRQEMEVEWMTIAEASQAIPPCYAQYLAQFVPGISSSTSESTSGSRRERKKTTHPYWPKTVAKSARS